MNTLSKMCGVFIAAIALAGISPQNAEARSSRGAIIAGVAAGVVTGAAIGALASRPTYVYDSPYAYRYGGWHGMYDPWGSPYPGYYRSSGVTFSFGVGPRWSGPGYYEDAPVVVVPRYVYRPATTWYEDDYVYAPRVRYYRPYYPGYARPYARVVVPSGSPNYDLIEGR